MSYDVQLYALETMNKHQQLNNENFFDHNENLVKLSEKQFFTLVDSSGKCNSIKTSHNFTRCILA